jgi:hypothetical protein
LSSNPSTAKEGRKEGREGKRRDRRIERREASTPRVFTGKREAGASFLKMKSLLTSLLNFS